MKFYNYSVFFSAISSSSVLKRKTIFMIYKAKNFLSIYLRRQKQKILRLPKWPKTAYVL